MNYELPSFPGIDAIREIQKQLHNELDNAWTAWAIQVSGLTPQAFREAVRKEYVLHAIDATTLDHIVCLPEGKGWRVIARGRAVSLHDEVTIHTVWKEKACSK